MWPYPWTHVGTPSHLGHMDRVAATMPSQAHAGAAQEAPDIGQWEGQDVFLVRPSSCNVKGGIPSSRRSLPTYLRPARLWDSRRSVRHPSTSEPQYQEHACMPWERDTPGSRVNLQGFAQRIGRVQARGHTLSARQACHAGGNQPSRCCLGPLCLGPPDRSSGM